MFRKFTLNVPKLILAIILMFLGTVFIFLLSRIQLVIAGKNLTSIGILVSGLIFYAGILAIITMFESETVLSIALLAPFDRGSGHFCLWFYRLVNSCLP